MNFEDEIELLMAELEQLQIRYDSLWNWFNSYHPWTLAKFMKGEEEE